MTRMTRILLAICLQLAAVACSPAGSSNPTTASPVVPITQPATLPGGAPTSSADGADTSVPFPHCKGMQVLKDPISFDWPNIEQRIRELAGSFWTYLACEQPATEAARLYREQLPEPPYNLHEMNWLEREEGTVGIYYTRGGLWDYVWIVPHPDDAQRSYVIIAESYTALSC